MNTNKIAAQLKAFAQTRPDIIAVYLYGSYANGTARPGSDIDIAILFSHAGPALLDAEIEVNNALTAKRGLEKAEVAALNRVPLKLQAEILQNGQRVYSRDEERRAAFEFDVMREWWDLQPWYATYNREYFAAVKENFTDDQRRAYQRARQASAATD